jgi:hypothetical protein
MGEQTDMMVDGTLCMGCGEYLNGEPLGIPRYCEDCDPETRKQDKAGRRGAAGTDFGAAQRLAARHGLILKRRSESHYQLCRKSRQWLLNIYPGNCRLYYDRNKQKPPFLTIDSPWTLLGVVEAMVRQLERR